MHAVVTLSARGRRNGSLDESDCRELPRLSVASGPVATIAEAQWAAELKKQKPQVWKVVWAVVWRNFCLGCLCNTLRGCSNAFTLPLLIKFIVEAIVAGDRSQAGLLLGLLIAERLVGGMVEHVGSRLLTTRVPSGLALSISGLVVNKSERLGAGSAQEAGVDPVAFVGRELNMLYARLGQSLSTGFTALPAFVAGSVTLVLLLGEAAVFGIVWVVLTMRVGMWMSTVAKKSEMRMSAAASERLTKLANVIGAVKAIKYFTWEPEFMEELADARDKELKALKARLQLSSAALMLGKITPVTGSLVTFISFALLGNEMRAADIFAANSVFMTMRFAVGASSMMVEVYKSTQVVFARAQKLLLLPERPPRALQPNNEAPVLASATELRVAYEGVLETFRLSVPGKLSLASSGQLTAVCGLVGSGKSTLLQALVGASDCKAAVSGEGRAVASVGWSPQKPFIISGTIRDNILLGRPYDEARMVRCIADACLGRDLELLQDGMEEVVGERGTTLSGGQQARLALARALYAEPDVLLLDDPLAAVDVAVGRAILRALRLRCASRRPDGGVPPGAVVVLNQLQVLPNFDSVVVVQGGAVERCGSFSEFLQHPAAASLLRDVETQTLPLDGEEDQQIAEAETQRASKHTRREPSADGLKARSSQGSLVTKEQAATGLVRWPVLKAYLLAPGGWFLFFVIALFVSTFTMLGLRDWWLTVWADADGGKEAHYIVVFVVFCLLHIAGSVVGVFAIAKFAQLAGQSLHFECIGKLMHAPMSYFDETPSGRITSRFGTDLAMVDAAMPGLIDFTMTFGFTFLMMCITVCANMPWMVILFAIAAFLSVPIIHGLTIFQQDVKRQSNNAMAPVLSNLSEVQRGAALADSMGCGEFFVRRHREYMDWWTRLSDASLITRIVAETWIQFMHVWVLLVVGLLTLRNIEYLQTQPGLVAMYFSYSALWGIFATVTMAITMGLITTMTSLERLLEYTLGDLPQEPPWKKPDDPDRKAWPSAGAVSFEGVVVRYREGLQCALDRLDLQIQGGERLGVVGRTGAGKSTITSALFRLVGCEAGRITIDGVDVTSLGVHTLRQAISMIPQEPIVMNGTVRYNLDPFDRHGKEELEEALRVVGLLPGVQLETPAGGGSLSAGQRQLLTFGRTTLQRSRIVVMDEPTASVDMQTDRAVQVAARRAFKGRTVVTIAHRLDTVKDCDRLAVMDAGRLVEIGPFEELLQNPASYLSLLVRAEEAPATVAQPASPAKGAQGGDAKDGNPRSPATDPEPAVAANCHDGCLSGLLVFR